jgi:hypothetical protein
MTSLLTALQSSAPLTDAHEANTLFSLARLGLWYAYLRLNRSGE